MAAQCIFKNRHCIICSIVRDANTNGISYNANTTNEAATTIELYHCVLK